MISATVATAHDHNSSNGSNTSATVTSGTANGSTCKMHAAPHAVTAPIAAMKPGSDRTQFEALVAMLWPCVLYLCCAFAMNMLTKILLTTYKWTALYTLGAVQNTFTMVSVGTLVGVQRLYSRHCSRSDAVDPATTTRNARPLLTLSYVLKVVLPLVSLHIGNMILGFASMRVVNMPMYLVLRRLTTLKVMLIEWLVLHKDMSTGSKLALLLSTVGSIVAGSTDATSDPAGYALVLLQNLCSALSLTFSKESALSSVELVLLNSVAGSVICSLLALQFERETVLTFPDLHDPRFAATVAVMCCVCVLYQFSIFICTLRNSALATSVTGNVKDLASTVCGFVLFSDARVHVANLSGVVLSFVGAYSFSYFKYLAFAQQATAATAAAGGMTVATVRSAKAKQL